MAQGPAIIVDSAGNPCSGTFGKVLPTANIAGTSTGTSAGMPIGGLNPSSLLTPLPIDGLNAVVVRPGQCPTHATAASTSVSTGTSAGKVMLSVYNNSSTYYQRIAGLYAVCPPQANTSNGLSGISSANTNYVPVYFGVYRITGHSAGTSYSPVMVDPGDDAILSPDFTVRTGSTITGKATSATFAWDASANPSFNAAPRQDICMKVWTMPPGSGLAVVNVNALSYSVNFFMMVICAQNIA